MLGKLKKHKKGYSLIVDNVEIAIYDIERTERPLYSLSKSNCEKIELGYDLDELYLLMVSSIGYEELDYNSFEIGFLNALNFCSDKKFSEEDMRRIMVYGYNKSSENEYLSRIPFDEYIQSLQQTEWDVEIEMEDGTIVYPDGENEIISQPRLDKDGCLILKRK